MLSREQVERLGEFLCLENLSQTAEKLLAHDAALRAQLGKGYGYLSRLLMAVAPHCEPLDTVAGVATQIDNYIAGLIDHLATLTTAHQQAVEALAERDAKIVMLYEEIGHKDSRIKAFQIAIDRTGKWGGGT